MDDYINSESNRLKQLAGKELEKFLEAKFEELLNDGILADFEKNRNFNHRGYQYEKQYLANFILKTLDDKYIVINSSNSFRQDRVKTQNYDVAGIQQNAAISDQVIASILLYPDAELRNTSFILFRNNIENKVAFSPATHVLIFSELLEFLENHEIDVQVEKELISEEKDVSFIMEAYASYSPIKGLSGSEYGKAGNKYEKHIVALLNEKDSLIKFKQNHFNLEKSLYNLIIGSLLNWHLIEPSNVIEIIASDNIKKLKNGGNAKTDVTIKIRTVDIEIIETLSIKNTTQSVVSCHDYASKDFKRVLKCENLRLGEYFDIFQETGSYSSFKESLGIDYSIAEFETLLAPEAKTLTEWACKGDHDEHNLIDAATQVSNFLLINTGKGIKFTRYDHYIDELFRTRPLKYTVPLLWTYPSKQRTKRIQFKLPIII